MPAGFLDVARAELLATFYWYKNNRSMLAAFMLWPYLMTGILLGLGYLFGDPRVYVERMGVRDPALFVLSASVVAMASVNIIDTVAGFTLYNRWIGTLPYILMSPVRAGVLLVASGLPHALIDTAVIVAAIAPASALLAGAEGVARLAFAYLLIVAGMVPLLGLAVLAASVLLVVREESNILSSLTPFLLLISGVFYPVEILPRMLQLASAAVPVSYIVEAARSLSALGSLPGRQLYMLAYALALMSLAYNGSALAAVRVTLRAAMRRGA
ncbi:MAG: ABC transporter permease [Thermoproteota archaeon]